MLTAAVPSVSYDCTNPGARFCKSGRLKRQFLKWYFEVLCYTSVIAQSQKLLYVVLRKMLRRALTRVLVGDNTEGHKTIQGLRGPAPRVLTKITETGGAPPSSRHHLALRTRIPTPPPPPRYLRSSGLMAGVKQGLFLPLIQLLWCFGFVNVFGCWGCVGGAAGIGATTSLTYRIVQFDANWIPLGVALWSLVLIVASEAAFLWQEQVALRSMATLLPALVTLWFLYKSVSCCREEKLRRSLTIRRYS